MRNADWSEINWDIRTLEIPAFGMKAGRPQWVPLSYKAVEFLAVAWDVSGSHGLIFPVSPMGKAALYLTLTALLRRLEIPAVPHGFRSSFRNWVEECTAMSWDVSGAALAHNVCNATESPYMRSDLFDQRRQSMQRWANYLAAEHG